VLPDPQLSRIIVQGDLWIFQNQQYTLLFDPGLGNPFTQLLVSRLDREQGVKSGLQSQALFQSRFLVVDQQLIVVYPKTLKKISQ